MRIQIQFSSDDEIKLPLSYNHLIQAFIYQNISDITIRKDLHDVGYVELHIVEYGEKTICRWGFALLPLMVYRDAFYPHVPH